MGGRPGGQARAGRGPHRVRQDALAAFLWALDRLASGPPPESPQHRCRVLYVSPLKALAVDVQRNLRSPARRASARRRSGWGSPCPTSRWACAPATRLPTSGASSPAPRPTCWSPRRSRCSCCSRRRRGSRCAGVTTVILDEVHAVAGTKRGAHLALSLERLDELLERARAAHRPLGHRPAARRGVHLPRRRPPGGGRAAAHPEDHAGVGRGAGARSRRPRRAARAGQLRRGGRSARPRAPRSGPRSGPRSSGACWSWCAPTGPRSCSPTPGGSPSGSRRGSTSWPPRRARTTPQELGRVPRGGDRAVRHRRGRACRGGEGPPRVDVAGAAHPRGGGAQGRRAALRGRHVQPGAGHRHGRGRSRHPGRGAAERGVGAAAGGPRGPPGRRGVAAGWCSRSTAATSSRAPWSPSG